MFAEAHIWIQYYYSIDLYSGFWLNLLSLQLDFTFQTGVEAVRILLTEGINKSATFVNTPKTLEHLG